jgi:hypothetical protein
VRKTSALIIAVGLIVSLSACTGSGNSTTCGTGISSGDASSIVTATGKFGVAPTVDFPTPLYAKTTQRTELLAGHGALLHKGESATVEATILNGATGAILQATTYGTDDGSLVSIGPSGLNGLTLGLQCARVGSRVAIVASPKDSTNGQGNPNIGLTAADSLVLVIDIKAGFMAKSDGVPQITPPQTPTVVLAPNGAPGIILTGGAAPTKLQIAVEKQGSGKKVAKDDYVVLKYTGMLWADKTIFDSNWTSDTATVLQMKSGVVVDGFAKGIIGQRVGSQVVIVAPPSAGYGAAGNGSNIPANATLVFVVDILGIVK